MKIQKIQWLEAVGFFVLANGVMLAGSDFPPPAGFWKITLASLPLSVCQWFYAGILLKRMAEHGAGKTFIPNLLAFSAAGIITTLCFVLLNGGFNTGGGIWLIIFSICFGAYGALFWFVNCFVNSRLKELSGSQE